MKTNTEIVFDSLFSRLKEVLIFEEGYKGFLYDDETGKRISAPKGKITGGIGHNFDDSGLDPELIDFLFNRDAKIAFTIARDLLGDEVFFGLDNLRMLGIVCMAFQLGAYRLAKFGRLLKAIKTQDWAAAEYEVLDSKLARLDAPMRAKRVSLLFRGIDPYSSIFIKASIKVKKILEG